MAISTCPNPDCERPIDIDGYVEHGMRTLFYCECGKIYDMPGTFGMLVEIPIEEVNLAGLEGKYPSQRPCDADLNRGIFIRKTRWMNYKERQTSEPASE